MQLWAKIFKDNRMLKDTTISDYSQPIRFSMHWTKSAMNLTLGNRSGWKIR